MLDHKKTVVISLLTIYLLVTMFILHGLGKLDAADDSNVNVIIPGKLKLQTSAHTHTH